MNRKNTEKHRGGKPRRRQTLQARQGFSILIATTRASSASDQGRHSTSAAFGRTMAKLKTCARIWHARRQVPSAPSAGSAFVSERREPLSFLALLPT